MLRIKKNLKIGDLDAEADQSLLRDCFVDKGDLYQLMDVSSPASIILGRTGSGKTALLLKAKDSAYRSSVLDPHDISIRYLEHSNIIQFLNELGIKLDLFYRILWRHILAVELLQLRYDIKSESDTRSLIDSFLHFIGRDEAKKRAFEYFSEWGDKFWLTTDEQLKELTKKFENQVKGSIAANNSGIDLTLEGAKALSGEERTTVTQRAAQAVSSIQIKKLNEVIHLLADYSFRDRQKSYFILIDKLDEDWADTETRCRFIRALIEEVKYLRNLEPVKILVALRNDLLDLVFDRTRDAGFQEEKYEAYLLYLRWSRGDLKELIERRINEVFRRQYTKDDVQFEDVFPRPKKGGGPTAMDYMLERTLLRPRDIFQYVNECLLVAYDRERVSWRAMFAAEATYSSKRLKSLKEEWSEIYPELDKTAELLRGLSHPFTRSSISEDRLDTLALELHDASTLDPCVRAVNAFFQSGGGAKKGEIISTILKAFYHTGIVGIKISTLDTFIWSYIDQPTVSMSEIKRANQIKIHKMLHRALEIQSRDDHLAQ